MGPAADPPCRRARRRASLTGRRASNASNASNASAAADAVAAAAAAADAERQRRGRRKPAAGDRYAANGAQSAVRRVESRRGGLDATRLGMLQDPRMRTTLKNILQTYHLDFMARLDQSRVAYTLHSVFVILAALAFCLETMVELQPIVPSNVWVFAEMVFTVFFTVELLARYVASRRSRSTFWSDPLIWVDIVSIVPFYTILLACRGDPFSQCSVRDAWYIRWLQAVKILRIFKISRHFSGTRVLVKAMRESKRALGAPVVMLLLSVTMFASVLFFLESGQWDPDNEVYAMEDGSSPLMVSIVNTGYFVVVTMTTGELMVSRVVVLCAAAASCSPGVCCCRSGVRRPVPAHYYGQAGDVWDHAVWGVVLRHAARHCGQLVLYVAQQPRRVPR